MCTGNDPACPIHGVEASNARQNEHFAMEICERCTEPLDKGEAAADRFGRRVHWYCLDPEMPDEVEEERGW